MTAARDAHVGTAAVVATALIAVPAPAVMARVAAAHAVPASVASSLTAALSHAVPGVAMTAAVAAAAALLASARAAALSARAAAVQAVSARRRRRSLRLEVVDTDVELQGPQAHQEVRASQEVQGRAGTAALLLLPLLANTPPARAAGPWDTGRYRLIQVVLL